MDSESQRVKPKRRILIATSNPGKLRDFSGAASRFGVEIAGIPNFSSLPLVVEDGLTFESNARKKAEAYSLCSPGELVLADDSVGRAASEHNRTDLGEALWVQGIVRARQGRREEAQRLFEGALSLAQRVHYPYLEARVLCEWGTMQAMEGETQQARAKLEGARVIFERLGARHDLKRSYEALRKIG